MLIALAVWSALGRVEADFEKLIDVYVPGVHSDPVSLIRLYVPNVGNIPVTEDSAFDGQLKQIFNSMSWHSYIESNLCGNSTYVGDMAGSYHELLRYNATGRGWSNRGLLMSTDKGGDRIVAADIVAIARDPKMTTLCERRTCPRYHSCVRVGGLPAMCVQKNAQIDDSRAIFVVLVLFAITALVYLAWETRPQDDSPGVLCVLRAMYSDRIAQMQTQRLRTVHREYDSTRIAF